MQIVETRSAPLGCTHFRRPLGSSMRQACAAAGGTSGGGGRRGLAAIRPLTYCSMSFAEPSLVVQFQRRI